MTRPPVYVIGSLRNPEVPLVAHTLREAGFDAFDDWYAAGPEADDKWQAYEMARGHSYTQALLQYPARHVCDYDVEHLTRCRAGVLVYPAGKSAHTEMGFMRGQGKPVYVWMAEEPARWDAMLNISSGVFSGLSPIVGLLKQNLGCS